MTIIKPPPVPKQPEYSLRQLATYIDLHNHLTGEMPKDIKVKKDFFEWYRRETKRTAKTMGFEAKKRVKMIFNDVELKYK